MNLQYANSFFRSWQGKASAMLAVVAGFAGVMVAASLIGGSPAVAQASQLADQSYFNENIHVTSADQSFFTDYSEPDSLTQASKEMGATEQCSFLSENLRIDFNNDDRQVYRLQAFLKAYEYSYVDLTGEFDLKTLKAVQQFQQRHAEDVLEPWGYQPDEATGYVYITTRQKINEIYCGESFTFTENQQAEINQFSQRLAQLRERGASFETPAYLKNYFAESKDSQADLAAIDTQAESVSGPADQTEDTDTKPTTSDEQTVATGGPATTSSGFFARLFGQANNNNDAANNNDAVGENEQATNTDEETGQTDETATDSSDQATSTATSGVDQVATSVYSGVNSVFGFVLSPTFLLILLAVLVLLLIATLLEDNGDGEGGESIDEDDLDFGGGSDDLSTDNNNGDDEDDSSDQDDTDGQAASDNPTGRTDDGLADEDPDDDVITFDADGVEQTDADNADVSDDEDESGFGNDSTSDNPQQSTEDQREASDPTEELFGDQQQQ